MKKYLLLCSALTVASSVQAADINCATPPSCAELGYVMTEADCEGFFALKCPFDTSKLFCGGDECKVGSRLYDNMMCYDKAPSGKTAIAIVFDTTNRLAVSLETPATYGWSTKTTDISAVPNKPMDAVASEVGYSAHTYYTTSETSGGISDTAAIVASQSSGNIVPAANKCYNSTYGGQDSWFLPTLGDITNMYNIRTTLGDIWNSGYYYWSSTETNDATKAWAFNQSSGPTAVGKASAPYYVLCAIRY